MSNYASSYASDWSAPDPMKRYSMYLTPKGKAPAAPGWARALSRLPGTISACASRSDDL